MYVYTYIMSLSSFTSTLVVSEGYVYVYTVQGCTKHWWGADEKDHARNHSCDVQPVVCAQVVAFKTISLEQGCRVTI